MTEHHSAVPATDPKKSWLDLSPVQVAGGALAAMTAAALGSRFSVEGTIVGAALASVIAAVASALYTASLRRTTAAVRGVLGGRRPADPKPTPTGATAVAAPPSRSNGDRPRWTRRRSLVLSSVLGALAIFTIAGGALTAYEAFAGQALSGGDGTTFSQVQPDRPESSSTPEPSPTPTESAEPSESADPTPTTESSETATVEPSPTAEPSAEPSTEPSATAETEPSPTAEAPSAAPSQTAETPR